MKERYKVIPGTEEIVSPNGRFYCYMSSWNISPAKASGAVLIRDIDKANYNPMVHDLMDKGLLADCVQVYADVIGGQEWINVNTNNLDHGVSHA